MALPRFAALRIAAQILLVATPIVGMLGALSWAWAFRGDHVVTFESRESRTVDGAPVYNRVRYFGEDGKVVWLMQQSHEGREGLERGPDRLAIIVERGGDANAAARSRPRARFAQFEPGPIGPGDTPPSRDVEREYAVSCGLCHANGPRALRPRWDSRDAPLGPREALLVTLWNVRIALSGRIENEATPTIGHDDVTRRVPFAPRSPGWDDPLDLPSCGSCHGGGGAFARAPLLRRHFLAIGFLTREGAMPPASHRVSLEDRRVLDAFLAEFEGRDADP